MSSLFRLLARTHKSRDRRRMSLLTSAPASEVLEDRTLLVGMIALGQLKGFPTYAVDVSADGAVVVGYGDAPAGTFADESFRWTDDEGIKSLGTAPNFQSRANGISADGKVIVGESHLTLAGILGAYRWTADDGLHTPFPPNVRSATSTSEDGSVIVGFGLGGPFGPAFRWTDETGAIGLDETPEGHPASVAIDASNDGTVIIGWSTVSGKRHAFRWTVTGGTQLLEEGESASGFIETQALAVSGNGSVIVGVGTTSDGTMAFRWTMDEGFKPLGDLLGGDVESRAQGVSADGSVIVGWSDSSNGREAFRWTEETGMVGLRDLDGGGFMSEAAAVSADGSVIVGVSESSTGIEAFRWTSEPTAVVNVVTHGWNPSPLIFPWQGFRDKFHQLGNVLDNIPFEGSALDGLVSTYVSEWDSYSGFTNAFVAGAASHILSELGLDAAAGVASDIANKFAVESRQHAFIAALDIFNDITTDRYLGAPGDDVLVHLIGHSRGAAVNALVSQFLSHSGYTVTQYSSLDGASFDWPSIATSIVDFDIFDTVAERRVNYRVQGGLDAALLSTGFLEAVVGPLSPAERPLLEFILSDLKAPTRTDFENYTIRGDALDGDDRSHHLNVVDLYRESADRDAPDDYILDNYVGIHRSDAVIAGPQERSSFVLAPVISTIPITSGSIRDGGFESIGDCWVGIEQVLDAIEDVTSNVVAAWKGLVDTPAKVLNLSWETSGDAVQLVFDQLANAAAQMTQAGSSWMGQAVALATDAAFIAFDLAVETAGAGDRLDLFFADELVSTFDLTSFGPASLRFDADAEADQHPDSIGSQSDVYRIRVPVDGIAGQSGMLRFELSGPEETPAVIILDDIQIESPDATVVGNGRDISDGDSTPSIVKFTDFGSVALMSPGITRTFTVRNDGTSTLVIANLSVPVGFTITEGLASNLAPGDSDTFSVRLNTDTIGTKSGEISFETNVANENPFNFAITGFVSQAAQVFVNDDFTEQDGTPIFDADPNTPGNQAAIIGANAFPTIQQGVDAVADWGTVHITDDLGTDGPGLYAENVSIGKNVAIRSTEDDAAAVVVDGWATGSVFSIGAFGVVLNALTIRNGLADDGGGILNNGGVLTITDSVVRDNTATVDGGGIKNDGGTVSLIETMLVDNSAGGSGGGLHNAGVGRMYVDGGLIDGNSAAEDGGGASNSNVGLLILRNGATVSGNRASGAGVGQGGGGVFNDGGRLAVLPGTTISGNVADGAEGSGGGIFSRNGVVTVVDSSITGNTANRAGGGIEMVSGIVQLDDSHLDNNQALGGPAMPGPATPGNGGGLHVTGRTGQVGYIRIIGGTVGGNSAASEGGGLWHQAGNIMTITAGAVIDGNTASGDGADGGGGGIFNNSGRLAISGGVVISNNRANGTSGSGGGIFSMGSGVSIDGSTLSENTANRAGGGIEVVHGLVTVVGSTIEGNVAGVSGGVHAGHGGGVHVSGMNFTRFDLRHSVVAGNTATQEGGGLSNPTNGVMLVRAGTQIIGNVAGGTALDGGGGGIFNRGRLAIHDALIEENSAAGSGGGILTRAGVTTIEDATVSMNVAHGTGGGIEIDDGILLTDNMTLTGNSARVVPSILPGNGGGLHIRGNSLTRVTIGGGAITGNSATNEGGGVWHQSGSILLLTGGTTISGNTASGNSALSGGGGIFNNGGRLAISGASIWGNSADGDSGSGGGILSLGGAVTLDNSTLSGNTANGDGGGIASIGVLIAAHATIAANRADVDASGHGAGGGLYNGGTATLANTIVAGNVATAMIWGRPISAANDIGGGNLQPTSGFNLIGDSSSAGGLIHGARGNQVGHHGQGIVDLDEILEPLADNGGPTLTHALANSSPALDSGSNVLAVDIYGRPFLHDQRGPGFPRSKFGIVDIGAFEA